MGVIQGSINNLLNTAAVAARLSPNYETRQEIHKTKKALKAQAAKKEAERGAQADELNTRGYVPATKTEAEEDIAYHEKKVELTSKLTELDPTKENAKEYTQAQRELDVSKRVWERLQKEEEEEKNNPKKKGKDAMKRVNTVVEAKIESIQRMRDRKDQHGGKK